MVHTLAGMIPESKTAMQKERHQFFEGLPRTQVPVITLSIVLLGTVERDEKTVNLKISYDAMQKSIQPLNKCGQGAYLVTSCRKTWNCHPGLILYCCDILRGKEFFRVKRGPDLYLCISCLVSRHGIREPKVGEVSSNWTNGGGTQITSESAQRVWTAHRQRKATKSSSKPGSVRVVCGSVQFKQKYGSTLFAIG